MLLYHIYVWVCLPHTYIGYINTLHKIIGIFVWVPNIVFQIDFVCVYIHFPWKRTILRYKKRIQSKLFYVGINMKKEKKRTFSNRRKQNQNWLKTFVCINWNGKRNGSELWLQSVVYIVLLIFFFNCLHWSQWLGMSTNAFIGILNIVRFFNLKFAMYEWFVFLT